MPYQGKTPDGIIAFIKQAEGAMWSTITDPTNGGTATARTKLEAHRVPDDARCLLGIRPVEYVADQAVAESQIAVFSIESGNYKFQPQEVIGGVVAGPVLLNEGMLHTPSEYYDVFAPVSGGESIDIWIEPLDAIAGNRRSSVEFTWSNVKVPAPTIYSLCSREVSTGTTVGAVPGTTLDLTSTKVLVEVGAVCTSAALTIEEELWGSLKVKSSALGAIQETDILLEPQGTIADLTADEGPTMAYLARRAQWLPFKHRRASVSASFDLDVALSAAGQFAHMLRWI